MFLGIEIGGTKLQVGIGEGSGKLVGVERTCVDPSAGAQAILQVVPLLARKLLSAHPAKLQAVGIGFGGPVDDHSGRVLKSHHVGGWSDFPLLEWARDTFQIPAAFGNDADVAGLAEALHGAGQGLSPIFYITVGSGIGGGLILDGNIHRGTGRGAAEIGHLRIEEHAGRGVILEDLASGWALARRAREHLQTHPSQFSLLRERVGGHLEHITGQLVGEVAAVGDAVAQGVLREALTALARAITFVIALCCPKRVIIGGGVSLLGETWFFEPLRRLVAERVFAPFASCYDLVPPALGEEVVIHGALAIAKQATSLPPYQSFGCHRA